MDDKSVSVPVFVQPESEQACLLGMNAIPLLAWYLCGTPQWEARTPVETDVVTVSLVESVMLPSQKGRAKAEG